MMQAVEASLKRLNTDYIDLISNSAFRTIFTKTKPLKTTVTPDLPTESSADKTNADKTDHGANRQLIRAESIIDKRGIVRT